MKATQIFGTHLLPTHEYVAWLRTEEGYEFINLKSINLEKSIDETFAFLVDQVFIYNSQPMYINLFVRGDEPKVENAFGGETNRLYRILKNEYDNWKPLLKGDFEIDSEGIIYLDYHLDKPIFTFCLDDFEIINDFATHCHKQGIPLELNEEFEI